jgi:hypothetical protein
MNPASYMVGNIALCTRCIIRLYREIGEVVEIGERMNPGFTNEFQGFLEIFRKLQDPQHILMHPKTATKEDWVALHGESLKSGGSPIKFVSKDLLFEPPEVAEATGKWWRIKRWFRAMKYRLGVR